MGKKTLIFILFIITGVVFGLIYSKSIFKKSHAVIVDNELNETVAKKAIVSFITPHHLFAEKIIEETYEKAAYLNVDSGVKRVFLISPNHSESGNGWIHVSNNDWNLENENVISDKEVIEKISKFGLAKIDNEAFNNEHGIKVQIPFVAKYFPKTTIIPIMIKSGLPSEKIDLMAEKLHKEFGKDSLFILSADFSHYLDENFAKFHDEKSIKTISEFDFENIKSLDIDCPEGLRLVMKISDLQGYEKFELYRNSNSSMIGGNNFIGETTSYISGFFQEGEKKEEKKKTIDMLFLGDLMLDRNIRQIIEKKGVDKIISPIERLFLSQDFNVSNLEGVITGNSSVSIGSKEGESNNYKLTFNPDNFRNFSQKARLNIFNINNNHIKDFGIFGLEETRNNLLENKKDFFGDLRLMENYLIKEIDGARIGFVGYSWFSGDKYEDFIEKIKKIKNKTDYLVAYTHWGVEYEKEENSRQEKEAHGIIDAGADLIIGSHPHVAQPMEIYNNGVIFYSLGNFVFDQYFSEETMRGLAVGLSVEKGRENFYLLPLQIYSSGEIKIAKNKSRTEILSRLVEKESIFYIKDEVLKGNFSILGGLR